jgi:DNA repair protein RadD
MALTLRPYQERLVSCTLNHLQDYPESQPLVVAPTASGKSVIVANLCERLAEQSSGMTLVLTHRKELVEQNHAKLPHHLQAGVYSSGLGKKQLKPITIAGFQSIRNQTHAMPRVDHILIDEAHYALKGYREFIDRLRDKNPELRAIGLTATPFDGTANRTALHLMPADKAIFTGIAAEVGMGELLRDGYLTPLTPYRGQTKLDTTGVAIDRRLGDFALGQLQNAVDTDDNNLMVAREISDIFASRRAIMVFCTGVKHCLHVAEALRKLGHEAECVLGNTPKVEREDIIGRFRAGRLKFIVACEVLLVGFDAPVCDGIANLRPTKSGLIWVQLCGRGMRLHDGKDDCLVADFTDTSDELGPIDEIEGNPPRLKTGETPTKMCDECFNICLAGLKFCPNCGYEFPLGVGRAEQNFDPVTGLLVSGVTKNEDGSKTYPVARVDYEVRNTSAGAPALVANYMSEGRATPVATCWYNMWHHKTNVSQRDIMKWVRRSNRANNPPPLTAQEALARATFGELKVPSTVTVRPGSPFAIRFGAPK